MELDAPQSAALARLQRFCRQRVLRSKWLELVEDLVDWNRLYKSLQENRKKRDRAAAVLQKGVRNSAATNVAMRVASRNDAPKLIKASAVVNAAARGWVARSRLKWEQARHAAFLAEAAELAWGLCRRDPHDP